MISNALIQVVKIPQMPFLWCLNYDIVFIWEADTYPPVLYGFSKKCKKYLKTHNAAFD